jgi:hypothetical protein
MTAAPDTSFTRQRKTFQFTPPSFIMSCVLAVGFWLIWRSRFIPSLDYPNWVRQGSILSTLLRNQHSSVYHLRHYPVPNSAVVLTLALLDLVLPPESAGKMLFSIALCMLVFGSVYAVTAFEGSSKSPATVLALSPILGRWFFLGSLSYFLGLGLLSLFVGRLIRDFRLNRFISPLFLGSCFFAFFFVHFTVLISAIAIACPLYLAKEGKSGTMALFGALLPIVLLTIIYAIGLHFDSRALVGHLDKLVAVYEPALWQIWSWRLLPGEIVFTFAPFHVLDVEVPETFSISVLLSAVNALWCSLVVLIAITSLLQAACKPDLRWAAICGILCFTLVIVTGRQLARGDIGNRLLIPAVWMGLACFDVQLRHERRPLLYTGLGLFCRIVLLSQLLWLILNVPKLDPVFSTDYQRLNLAASSEEFCKVYSVIYLSDKAVNPNTVTTHPWLLPMTPVQRGIVQYIALDHRRFESFVGINDVSVLASSNLKTCAP